MGDSLLSPWTLHLVYCSLCGQGRSELIFPPSLLDHEFRVLCLKLESLEAQMQRSADGVSGSEFQVGKRDDAKQRAFPRPRRSTSSYAGCAG